jgi:hypothetical protein
MVKIEIRCPKCSKRNKIEVSEEEVKNTTRGLYAVNVSEGIICEHSFVAYLDKNLVVRDTFIADFQITLPETTAPQEEEEPKLTDNIDIDLIKINLTASTIAFILRAMLFKKKIIIISDKEFLGDHLLNLFKFVTSEAFDVDLSLIPINQYNTTNYGDHIAIKGIEIIKDDDKIIDPKKLKMERTITQAFLNETDPKSSILKLKKEIKLIYDLSSSIADIVNNLKKSEKLYSKTLIEKLKDSHNVKVQMPYLDYLIEVTEHYFNVKVPLSSNISNFLGTL